MIRLRVTNKSDYAFLYTLLESRDPSHCISHIEMPTRFESDLFNNDNPYLHDYVILEGPKKIGRAYMGSGSNIGVHLMPNYRKKEIIKTALLKIIEISDPYLFHVNITPSNKLYATILEELGMNLIQCTYEKRGS